MDIGLRMEHGLTDTGPRRTWHRNIRNIGATGIGIVVGIAVAGMAIGAMNVNGITIGDAITAQGFTG